MRVIRIIIANRASGRFWSIEEIFSNVVRALPDRVTGTIVSAPRARANLGSLFGNLLWLWSRKNADLVHQTGDIHYAILGVWRYPVVLTIHDLRFIEEAQGLKRFLFWWLWLYLPCKRANRVTVISDFTMSRLLALCNVNPAKVRVIPNCVSPEFLPQMRPLDPVRPLLLLVGTTPNKNLDRIAAACQGLLVKLAVLGILSNAQKVKLEKHELEYEAFHALTKTGVVNLYQTCDLVVFVSTYEGFGLPILEAQAVGRPVLTSSFAPMSDVAGEGALKVDPFDVAAIRSGLQRLLEEPELREELVQKGFENVKKYSATAIAAQYASLYREVLENP